MTTLVCFALKEEAAPLRKVAAGIPGTAILIAGVGRQNAERSVRRFLDACSPKLVLTCGFAGGLDPKLKLGEVVFEMADSVPAEWEEKLLAAGAKPVKFFCASRVATTAAEKQKLRQDTGADAVEMESAAIHAVCRERGLPCVTVRVISDPAGEDLPLDFNVLTKPDQSLDFMKLALAIAKSPWKIGGLLALQKHTSLAARQLAAVLKQVISQ
jgi:adenosylhomocysteine nucleosidase